MSTLRRTKTDLLKTAAQYAAQRGAPVATITKELLHFELIYALTQSGAARSLVFQGGTALRLCWGGDRYSEDLDFAGGRGFDPKDLDGFEQILKEEIGAAYGLEVQVKTRTGGDGDGLDLHRWQTRIVVPQINPALPQKQVINLEVASIPAHDVTTQLVTPTYPHLATPFRSMAIRVETMNELLADKVKALVARPFMKARDIYDIKFLRDRGVELDTRLLLQKLDDYGWTREAFAAACEKTLARLRAPEASTLFITEMSRFVDRQVADMFDQRFVDSYLRSSIQMVQRAMGVLQNEVHTEQESLSF